MKTKTAVVILRSVACIFLFATILVSCAEAEEETAVPPPIDIPAFCDDSAVFNSFPDDSFRIVRKASPVNASPVVASPRLPEQKITRYVRERMFYSDSVKQTGEVGLVVIFKKDAPLIKGKETIRNFGANDAGAIKLLNAAVVSVPLQNLDEFLKITEEESVDWIALAPPRLSEMNDDVRRVSGVDRLQAIWPQYNGFGIIAGIYDSATACDHEDFAGRLIVDVEDTSYCASHATHVAGTLGGSGLLSEEWGNDRGFDIAPLQFRGMAPGVKIISFGLDGCEDYDSACLYNDPADIEEDFKSMALVYDVDSVSMSLGVNVARNGEPCAYEGDTCLVSILGDTIVSGAFGRDLIYLVAAGNERSPHSGHRCGDAYGTLGPPASGMKNAFIIGAVDNSGVPTDFTSWGPADDGRIGILGCTVGEDVRSTVGLSSYEIKSGTSMSAPAMHGMVDLLLQAYYRRRAERMTPALGKAIVATSLAETPGTPDGPDFRCGFGYTDEFFATEVIQIIEDGRYFEDAVKNGEEITYLLVVPPGSGELKITIVWTDKPGSIDRQEAGLPQLVNDIDMTFESVFEGEVVHYPLRPDPSNPENAAAEGEDRLNNIEQITTPSPVPGCYLLKVKGYNVPEGPQNFAVAYKGVWKLPFKPKDFPSIAERFPLEPVVTAPPKICGGH